jgi:hypothetical protein
MANKDTFEVPVTFENEPREESMKYIESKRNWDVENQIYRMPPEKEREIERTTNLKDCKIFWRGQYLVVEYNDTVYYWDSLPYCFLKQAVEFMQLEKPAKWKTLDKLISLRMGIRQTEVNGCGYVDEVLEGNEMTYFRYKEFMSLARAQDYQHHGSHTF